MKMLIDDVKLNLLLEKKKQFIGKKVTWDSILSASSFLLSVLFASYNDIWIIKGFWMKIFFMLIGCIFTLKAIFDVWKSSKNSYSYEDLLKDINTLNEITHDHSIVAIRDLFNEYSNRFLVYDDHLWSCKLFINYKDNAVNNERFIIEHLSREFKIDESKIKLMYISQLISEKVSGRDNKNKVYCHKLFSAIIEEFPENMKNNTFTCEGHTYHWETIAELETDVETMKKNSDIIEFVKNNI